MRRETETGAASKPHKRRFRLRPLALLAGLFGLAALIGGGGFATVGWLLSRGPIESAFLTERIAEAVSRRLGDGFQVDIRTLRLIRDDDGLVLEGDGVTVRDGTGTSVVAAPRVVVGFDGRSLLRFDPVPREVEFVGLSVALTILPDGAVSVSAVQGLSDAPPAPAERATDAAPLRVSSFVDAFAAPKGALAILERAGLRDGSLVIDDRRNGRTASYSDLSMVYSRPAPGESRMALRARGPNGRWGASVLVRGLPGEARTVEAALQDVAVSELLGFAHRGGLPVHTDMPLSFELTASLAADDRLTALEGVITGGSAQILIDDPHMKPIAVDRVGGRFGLDADGGRLEISELDLVGAGLRMRAKGWVEVPRDAAAGWRFSMASDDAAVSSVFGNAPAVRLTRLALDGVVSPGFTGIELERAEFGGPEVDIALSASLGRTTSHDGLALKLRAARMPTHAVLALWPSFAAPDTRRYFGENLEGGTVDRLTYDVNFSPDVLRDAFSPRPLPDDAVRLEVAVSGGVLRPAPGLPVLAEIAAEGVVTGRTATVRFPRASAKLGPAGTLLLTEGSFRVDDTSGHPAVAAVGFRMRGGAEAFAALLRADALRGVTGGATPEPSGIKGQTDSRIAVSLPLVAKPAPDAVKATAQGVLTNIAVERLVAKEKLESPSLAYAYDAGRLSVKGEARIGGIPAVIDLVQRAGATDPDYAVTLTIDDAVRVKRGLKSAGLISGPVVLKAVSRDGTAKGWATVEADFSKAAITGLLPTWAKPAGKAAKATLRMRQVGEDRFELADIVLDGGNGLVVRGEGEVAADGSINVARLSQVRLSPGDDMKVEIDRGATGAKMTVRATALDARPFLKSAFAPAGGPSGVSFGDLDLDLKATALQGFSGEVLNGAELRLATRTGDVRDFRLAGRLGRSAVSGQMARSEAGSPAMVVESADAGAFLRYIDLYRRMVGGAMLMQVSASSEPLDGLLVVQNFSLRNEPALTGVSNVPENKSGRALLEDASNVSFTKLRAEFARSGNGLLTLSDAVMWGPTLGGTLEGTMDFGREKVDMTGTFVPAYGLNNIPNKVPIFGLLFGGANEGLFAVNFRITGSPANPVVTFNPLSAVAPGFLRKFFGAGRPDGAGTPVETDATAKPAPKAPPATTPKR